LSCLTRYLGVALVAGGVLLFLFESGSSSRRRIGRAVLFAAVSLAPIALWLARNLALTGTVVGPREPPGFGLASQAADLARSVVDWSLPWSLPTLAKAAVLALASTPLVLARLRRKPKRFGFRSLALPALVYGASLVSVSATWGSDAIDVRLA